MGDEDASEYLKLPVEDRCVHKLWKARVSGYEEVVKNFNQWDGDDQNWKKYLGLVRKFVTDSNAVAQEKGLEAALAFVENCDIAGKTVSDVIEGIVVKCVAAPKTKTKDLAKQIVLMYCEAAEVPEKVIEELIKGFSQKNPKVVSGCVNNVTEVLRCFGAKVIKVSPLLKAVLPLLDHRDKGVREEGKQLIIESYRWIGELMKAQLTGLKPVQLTELEAEFGKLEDAGRAKPTRWLKSQRPMPGGAKIAAGDGEDVADGDDADEPEAEEEVSDPYDLMDPVDILSKLPKNFYELVEEKKWQLRKEALDALLPLAKTPKIANGDFFELIKVLKKFIGKDTNVMLVALAAQCLAGLCKGLRGQFKQGASHCLSVCLEKFKEKKANVVAALVEAVDAMYPILGVEGIQEDALAALKHKTPSVNAETGKWLARCFSKCPPQLATNKKVLKGYVSALEEKFGHSDATVRESAFEAVGVLFKYLGENQIMKLLPDLDPIKLAKVKEFEEKAELSGKVAAAPKPKPKAVVSKPKGPRVVKPEPAAAPPKKPSSAPVKKSGKAAPKKAGSKEPAGPGPVKSEMDMGLEEAEEVAKEFFGDAIVNGLGDANWKKRLAVMEEVVSKLNGDDLPALASVKVISAKKPGIKDNNFQVMALRIQALQQIAQKGQFSLQCWDTITPDVIEKLSDAKNAAAIKELLYVIAENTNFGFVFNGVLEQGFASKSPKVKAEVFACLTEGLKMFGPYGVQAKMATSSIKKGLAETNPAVRTAAIGFLGVLHWFMGPAVKRMFEDEKAAILTQIDAEIEKYAGQSPPVPTRGPKAGGEPEPVAGEGSEDEEEDEDSEPRAPAPRKTASAAAGPRKTSAPKSRLGLKRPGGSAPAKKKTGEDIDTSPPYIASNLKNVRFKEEQKLKVLKWNFTSPKAEFVEQLKGQMVTANFNKTLMAQMYHSDFKQHLKAIETMSNYLESDLEGLISNLDLILKWMTLRFFETNPSVLLKGLEYLKGVFSALADANHSLHDIEANSFVPFLINKSGDPKDQVRASIRNIYKSLTHIFPASKLVIFLLDGIKSKNAKQRSECLEELGDLIRGFGTNVLQPQVGEKLREIAKQISDRDNLVRNAALNCVGEVYFKDGERMYKLIGSIPEKDMAMLEERIKRLSKNRPAPGSEMPPPPAPAPQSRLPSADMRNGHPPNPRAASAEKRGQTPTAPMAQRQPSQPRQQLPRPASGAFTLDLDKIEGDLPAHGRVSEFGMRLIDHKLDDIFGDEPVALPTTRTTRLQPFSPTRSAPNLQSPVRLVENAEAYEALDVVLSQVFNHDAKTCLSALKQLETLFKDDEKVQLMSKRMDQLLQSCYMQYRHVLYTKMQTDNYDPSEVVRIFQFLTVVLLSMYHHSDIVKNATLTPIHDLLSVIINILLEPKVQTDLREGAHLLRALNVLPVKIIERSDHTAVTCALLKLLKDAVGNATLRPKFMELTMKCIWKVIRLLPSWIDDQLRLDAILAELHDFMKMYPSSYWKSQESDTPMRTVKTVLHALAKAKGDDILDHLTKIHDPQNSELLPYLKKLLNTGVGGPKDSANGNMVNKRKISKSDHEALAEIFKKIGCKEQTKQGLQELYNFRQQNPHVDLEPFMAKSSQYFRDYIEKGLRSIEREVGTDHVINADSLGDVDAPQQQSATAPAAMQYLDRLKKLRAQGGLDNDQENLQENIISHSAMYRIATTTTSSVSSSGRTTLQESSNFEEQRQSVKAEPKLGSSPNVEDIRKRLERIKQNAF